jgi:hypothetical protein
VRVPDSNLRSGCRLAVDQYGANLDGSPDDLRRLAEMLERDDELIVTTLRGDGSPALLRRRTEERQLSITLLDGPALELSGDSAALNIVVSSLRGVAMEADVMRSAPVRRHVHIEYLGEGDDIYRSPKLFPLEVTSDWPD